MKVRPAILTVPLRGTVEVFAATTMPTLPLPVPLAPLVTVSHAALLVADQAHELTAATDTVVVSLVAPDARLDGEMV